MEFNRDTLEKILIEKGATAPCHRCGKTEFSILDQIASFPLQEKMRGLRLGGATVPAALIICNNCGAITPHAIGALGLLREKEENDG